MRCARCKKKTNKTTFSFSTGEKICINCKEKERDKVIFRLHDNTSSIEKMIKEDHIEVSFWNEKISNIDFFNHNNNFYRM